MLLEDYGHIVKFSNSSNTNIAKTKAIGLISLSDFTETIYNEYSQVCRAYSIYHNGNLMLWGEMRLISYKQIIEELESRYPMYRKDK